MTFRMRSRVEAWTDGESLTTRETVVTETLALRAISLMETLMVLPLFPRTGNVSKIILPASRLSSVIFTVGKAGRERRRRQPDVLVRENLKMSGRHGNVVHGGRGGPVVPETDASPGIDGVMILSGQRPGVRLGIVPLPDLEFKLVLG